MKIIQIICIHPSHVSLSIFFIFFSCSILSLIASCSPSGKVPPRAVKGVLDLRDWELSASSGTDPSAGSEDEHQGIEQGNDLVLGNSGASSLESDDRGKRRILNLDGEWEFYWEEFPVRDETGVLQLPEDKKEFINVPGSWKGKKIFHKRESGEREEETLEGIGYATYRLKIYLKKGGNYALRVPDQISAYSLYLENHHLVRSGRVGMTMEESVPKRNVQVIPLDLSPHSKELTLILTISNFHNDRGGFYYSMQFGKEEDVLKLRESSLLLDIFVFGILFIMGIYHLSLYSLHREDRSALYFGLFCLLISLRTLLTGERYLQSILPNMSYSTDMTIDFLSLYLGIPIFLEFLDTLYPKELDRSVRIFLLSVQFFLSIMVIALSPLYFTQTLKIFQILIFLSTLYTIYILIKAVREGRKGARTFLLGFLVFAIVVINDLLNANLIINTGQYTPIGLVALIFSQALLLSSRFANTFQQVKDLSQNLERKVEERTHDLEVKKNQIEVAYQELQETQAQLIESERMASLGQLVGGIAHEINNPISVVRSHAELLEMNNRSSLEEVPPFLDSLTTKEKTQFFTLVNSSLNIREFLNSKEERKRRKEIAKDLEEIISEEDLRSTIAEKLVLLRLTPPFQAYIESLGAEKFLQFLRMTEIFKNQSNSISSIGIAVEKASRVVFALRNYLNTQIFMSKKEVDLVYEVERSLHVYDNYIIGKINVCKEFPGELKYNCVSENLTQVWKNIIFNAVQAMYDTDKKLEVFIQKIEKIPESFKSYRTSSILEESIFQKTDAKNWIVVGITDSGVGIPVELQEKVFTPFFTTKSLGEGIGLGLYTCKKIVHEHGGALYFKSEEGRTEFVVVLPE